MKIISAAFIERIKRTPTVESFRFTPGERLDFLPGQFLQVIFDPKHPDNKELNKYLSFSTPPGKNYFEVTKRFSESVFSQKLRGLKTGDAVSFKTPMGNCVFKDEYKKIAFLIGGIGVTPVISILEYICQKNLDTDVILLYSNRTEEEIAFKKELDALASQARHIRILYTVTDCVPKDNRCLQGAICNDTLKERLPDISERICFIFGPPRMVEAMKCLCIGSGAREENLKLENFIGY